MLSSILFLLCNNFYNKSNAHVIIRKYSVILFIYLFIYWVILFKQG